MKQQIRFCHAPDGVRIAYATTGTGPPLIRVTNWLTHLNLDWESPVWHHWFKALSQGQQLVRYDARGTGLSDRKVDRLSLDAWIQDLAAVVDALQIDRFPLLGLCQGGAIAVAYAARYPERVTRLVLYDSYVQGAFVQRTQDPIYPGDARVSQRTTLDKAREAEVLAGMIEVGWGREAAAFRQVFTNLLIPGATTEQQRWFAELQRRTVSPRTAARLWRLFHTLDVRQLAPQVTAPTLVLHVRGDRMVPFEQGLELASLIPNAHFAPLEGRNHILRPDEPAWPRFLSEVRDFLGTHMPQSSRGDLPADFAALTPRECEVLDLLARGLTNSEIAEHLVISPKTVRNHVTRVYSKLQTDTRAQAVILAREAGFGQSQP
jgi:pimeloyl-ACP methyl ester carboxylesterase/DNA-binding CsgD family transcriptional regulator